MAQHYPTPFPPPREPRPTGDVVATTLLSLVLLGALAIGFFWSLFAFMATDGCGTPGRCSNALILIAYVVAWGGIAAAFFIAVIGTSMAIGKRTTMYVWPARALALLVVTMVAGGFLLHYGVGG
jgi:hypothetical protein